MRMLSLLSLHSMRTRLTLWNVGVLALILVTLGTVFIFRVRSVVLASVDRQLASNAHRVQDMLNERQSSFFGHPPHGPDGHGPDGQGHGPHPGSMDRGPSDEMRPHLLDLQKKPFPYPGTPDSSMNEPWDSATFALSLQGREVYSTVSINQESVRVFSVPMRQNQKIIGVGQFAHSLAQIQQDEEWMTATLLALIPLGLLIAGLGGAFLTNRALRPVRQITQTAGQIGAGNLSGRLTVPGKDEFAHLAETFNGMLERLERAFGDLGQAYEHLEAAYEQQRRFTADASHELRTPLTIIKANASLALTSERTPAQYRKTLHAVDAAADRMNRIVQDLLLLARSDAEQLNYPLVPTPLAGVMEQAVAAVSEANPRPIHIAPSLSSFWVQGQADSLVRLFWNSLENAARHTPADGRILVSAERLGEQVIITVEDTGEGIPPEHLPHVMERFYRVDSARARTEGGTGLGLAICRSIVEMHGGGLQLQSAVGQGTIVRVTLPGSESAPALPTAKNGNLPDEMPELPLTANLF